MPDRTRTTGVAPAASARSRSTATASPETWPITLWRTFPNSCRLVRCASGRQNWSNWEPRRFWLPTEKSFWSSPTPAISRRPLQFGITIRRRRRHCPRNRQVLTCGNCEGTGRGRWCRINSLHSSHGKPSSPAAHGSSISSRQIIGKPRRCCGMLPNLMRSRAWLVLLRGEVISKAEVRIHDIEAGVDRHNKPIGEVEIAEEAETKADSRSYVGLQANCFLKAEIHITGLRGQDLDGKGQNATLHRKVRPDMAVFEPHETKADGGKSKSRNNFSVQGLRISPDIRFCRFIQDNYRQNLTHIVESRPGHVSPGVTVVFDARRVQFAIVSTG